MTRVYIHFTVDAQLHVGLASHGKYIRGPSVGLATFRGLLVVVSRRGGVCSGGRLTHIALESTTKSTSGINQGIRNVT